MMRTRCTETNNAIYQEQHKHIKAGRMRRMTITASAALLAGMLIHQPTLYAADKLVGSKIAVTKTNNAPQAGADQLQGITIGMSEAQLFQKIGQPVRKDLSEYGFEWYIYNQDYKHYLQVGVQDHKVVALYTNAKDSYGSIGFGSTKQEVEAAFGSSLSQIRKGNTIYNMDNSGQYSLYKVGDMYATVFYDLHQRNTVTAVQFIAQDVELAFKGYFGTPSKRLQTSFEQQILDLANAVRVREGMKPLKWNEKAAGTARKHSDDMGLRSFFDHNNPDGKSPFDRLKADGIVYQKAGENIAAGQSSAIFVHENWMNSKGHRSNILGDFSHLGVGVYFGGKSNVYYTQNFVTPNFVDDKKSDVVSPSLSKPKVLTGDPLDVKVEYSVSEAVYSASFSLTYDSRLTLLDIKPSVTMATYQELNYPGVPLITTKNITDLPDGQKQLNYSVNLNGGAYEGDGDIATITFLSDQEGKYTFNLANTNLFNANNDRIRIGYIHSSTVEVIKPSVPNPKPELPISSSSSGGSRGSSSSSSSTSVEAIPAGKTMKAGLLAETKKDHAVNAEFKINANTVKEQLQDKNAKQVQSDISDVSMKDYNKVSFTLDKSVAKLLQESGKDLLLSAAEFDITIPNKSIVELIGTSGLELVVSLAEHKDKGFSNHHGETTFTSPMITIRGPQEAKNILLEISLKLMGATKDILKAGVYAQTQGVTTNAWSYKLAGMKASDKKHISFQVTQFGTYTIAEHAISFNDLTAHWAKDEIEVIAAHGLLRGKDSIHTFKPNDAITQAEFATLLDRLTNNGKTWEQRIAEPGARKPITREKMVVMLTRALKADLSHSSASLGFKDEALISQDAKTAVVYAVSKGLIKGTTDNKFDPAGTLTRAQAAIVLYRVINEQ
ncbi:CAP-associated domain-containing protein [Paenibacillus alvei]|uniref:CAP-associated domain-containing protein n=1 Tax=Paenibacillus alvei TaxID=44250 RepID=UPI00227E818B|nr:CAP-associated domain-containing protein [Paenibacillus alvei]MCY7483691.1 CAP domain-containing protein [Paenibacillus alvei]